MIHQVIHPGLHPLRRAEIYPICFAYILHTLPRPRQPHNTRMELRKVGFQHGRCIPRRITRDEDGEERLLGRVNVDEGKPGDGVAFRGGDEVDHFGHFVEFFGADVRAVGEAKVDLRSRTWLAPSLHHDLR